MESDIRCAPDWQDFDNISGVGENWVLFQNIKKASDSSHRLMKFVMDRLIARKKEMISMSASIKASAEKARKRKEQEKLRENREQQKIEAKLAAKANGSPSKGISIARTVAPKMSAR